MTQRKRGESTPLQGLHELLKKIEEGGGGDRQQESEEEGLLEALKTLVNRTSREDGKGRSLIDKLKELVKAYAEGKNVGPTKEKLSEKEKKKNKQN